MGDSWAVAAMDLFAVDSEDGEQAIVMAPDYAVAARMYEEAYGFKATSIVLLEQRLVLSIEEIFRHADRLERVKRERPN